MYQYDEDVKRLAAEGKGGRLIAKELNISVSTAYRVMKRLELLTSKKNQHQEITGESSIGFTKEGNLEDAAETYLKYLCELSDYEYCTPSRRAPYDLLVDFGDGFRKVQVKSSKHIQSNGYSFGLRRTRNNTTSTRITRYSKDEVDYFFFHSIDGRSWLIPFSILSNVSNVIPSKRYSAYEIGLVAELADASCLNRDSLVE